MTVDPYENALSMIEKIRDNQTRASLGYVLGLLKGIEIKLDKLNKTLL